MKPITIRPALAIALTLPSLPLTSLADYADIWDGGNGNYGTTIWEDNKTSPRYPYFGNDYIAAINAGIDNLTPGRTTKETVHVWVGGNSGINPNPASLKHVKLRSHTAVDFHNNTINVNDPNRSVVAVYADRVDHIEIRNVKVIGMPRYGFWIRSCNDTIISGITMNFTGADNGIGIRADNYTRYPNDYSQYMWGFQLLGSNTFTGMSANNHGVETANVGHLTWSSSGGYSGYGRIDTVTSTDVGGCSVLLNRTTKMELQTVTGTRCCQFGGYASFRMANQAGPSIHVDKVVANSCGRGVFTTTQSHGLWLDEVQLVDSYWQGVLLQRMPRDSAEAALTGGRIGHWTRLSGIRDSREGGIRNDDQQNNTKFYKITLRGNSQYGIRETDGSGNNQFYDMDASNNGAGNPDNVILGAGSTFTGYQ